MRHALVSILVMGCVPRLYTTDFGNPLPVPTDDANAWSPPDNRWPSAEPPGDLVGEGWQPGQVLPEFRAVDQFGEEVSSWQFHGNVMLLDVSTMWCAPCQELAAGTQGTIDYYAEQPFVYLTVLQEDVEGEEPELSDLNLWADNFGITGPVVADGERQTEGAVVQGLYPAVLLVGPDLRVIERVNPPEDAEVHRAIDDALETMQ